MTTNKNNLDERINYAFSVFYTQTKKCRSSRPKISDILDNLKLVKYDSENENNDEILESLFNAKFRHVSNKNNTVSFTRVSDKSIKSRIDFVFYASNGDISKNENTVNYNLITKYLLSSNQERYRFINIPLLNLDAEVSNEHVAKFIKEHNEFKKIKKKKFVSIQVSEHFFKSSSLSDEIKNMSEEQVKSIIFQYALFLHHSQSRNSAIRFNHKLDDCLLYVREASDRKFNYFINKQRYTLKDEGVQLKVHDFSNTSLGDELVNKSLKKDERKEDNTYDLLNILGQMQKKSSAKDIIKNLIKKIKSNKYTPSQCIENCEIFKNWQAHDEASQPVAMADDDEALGINASDVSSSSTTVNLELNKKAVNRQSMGISDDFSETSVNEANEVNEELSETSIASSDNEVFVKSHRSEQAEQAVEDSDTSIDSSEGIKMNDKNESIATRTLHSGLTEVQSDDDDSSEEVVNRRNTRKSSQQSKPTQSKSKIGSLLGNPGKNPMSQKMPQNQSMNAIGQAMQGMSQQGMSNMMPQQDMSNMMPQQGISNMMPHQGMQGMPQQDMSNMMSQQGMNLAGADMSGLPSYLRDEVSKINMNPSQDSDNMQGAPPEFTGMSSALSGMPNMMPQQGMMSQGMPGMMPQQGMPNMQQALGNVPGNMKPEKNLRALDMNEALGMKLGAPSAQGMQQQGMMGMPQQGMMGMPQQGMMGMPQQGMMGMPQQGMMGMPQGMQQMNPQMANNLTGSLPEGYSGNVPPELMANLPMMGGSKKKKA
jgi:hypothetical protein